MTKRTFDDWGGSGRERMHSPHPRAQDVILGTDHRLEHEKVLVDCLTFDRVLVEVAEGIHDALLALSRRSVNL